MVSSILKTASQLSREKIFWFILHQDWTFCGKVEWFLVKGTCCFIFIGCITFLQKVLGLKTTSQPVYNNMLEVSSIMSAMQHKMKLHNITIQYWLEQRADITASIIFLLVRNGIHGVGNKDSNNNPNELAHKYEGVGHNAIPGQRKSAKSGVCLVHSMYMNRTQSTIAMKIE